LQVIILHIQITNSFMKHVTNNNAVTVILIVNKTEFQVDTPNWCIFASETR